MAVALLQQSQLFIIRSLEDESTTVRPSELIADVRKVIKRALVSCRVV